MLSLELAVRLIVQERNIVAVILRSTLDMLVDPGAYGLCSHNMNTQSLIAVNVASGRA